ncbi:MAG: hypothetical protein V4674_01135 [Patescibacteria group bacterium]
MTSAQKIAPVPNPIGYRVICSRNPLAYDMVYVGDEIMVYNFPGSGDAGHPLYYKGTLSRLERGKSGITTGIGKLRNATLYHKEGGPQRELFVAEVEVNLNPDEGQTSYVVKIAKRERKLPETFTARLEKALARKKERSQG